MVAFSLNTRTGETRNLDDGSLRKVELTEVEVKTILELVRSEIFLNGDRMPMDKLEVLDDIIQALEYEPEGNWTNSYYRP
jgi:hypothetical protein